MTIPNSVTCIEGGAFSGCTGLTSITIPDSITHIEYRVFSGCTGLTSITFPRSVTDIASDAFYDNNNLKDFYIHNETPPTWSPTWLYNEDDTFIERCSLHVPKGCKEAYENEEPWCDFKEIVDDL